MGSGGECAPINSSGGPGSLVDVVVAVDPADPCGACAICRAGHEELCATMRFAGHGTTDGGLRGFMSWPERLLHPVPDSIGDAETSLLEAPLVDK